MRLNAFKSKRLKLLPTTIKRLANRTFSTKRLNSFKRGMFKRLAFSTKRLNVRLHAKDALESDFPYL